MSEKIITFREFLMSEMRQRNMSMREFASVLGINHSTLNRFLDPRSTTEPSARTLAIISHKLDVPIETLFSMAFPDVGNIKMRDNPEIQFLVQQIAQLPPEQRDVVEAMIRGLLQSQK